MEIARMIDREMEGSDRICDRCAAILAEEEAERVLSKRSWARPVATAICILMLLLVGLSLMSCSSTPPCAAVGADAIRCATEGTKYKRGDVVRARHFSNFPQYEGELVVITGELRWRWIRGDVYQGNALKVYEVETSDGRRLAAQEFQLQDTIPSKAAGEVRL